MTNQLASAPYMAFTPSDTPEYIRERFIARYGTEPQEIIVKYATVVLAGPIPTDKDGMPVAPKITHSGRL